MLQKHGTQTQVPTEIQGVLIISAKKKKLQFSVRNIYDFLTLGFFGKIISLICLTLELLNIYYRKVKKKIYGIYYNPKE